MLPVGFNVPTLVTEAMVTVAQDQALNTHWLGYHILGTSNSNLCRRCHQFSETIEHNYSSWIPTISSSCILGQAQCSHIGYSLEFTWIMWL